VAAAKHKEAKAKVAAALKRIREENASVAGSEWSDAD